MRAQIDVGMKTNSEVEIRQQFENPREALKSLISRAEKKGFSGSTRPDGGNITDTRGVVQEEWSTVETRISDEESASLASDYRAGLQVARLSEKYGVHRMTVWRHLRAHGLTQPQNFLTEEKAERAVALYQAGMTLAEAANEVGSNRTSVAKALEDRRVPRRPRGVRVAFDPSLPNDFR